MTARRRVLYRNARVLGGGSCVATEDDRIVLVGDEDGAEGWLGAGDGAPDVVDLDGALVTPGFVDAHVHTVRTGFALTGLDLAGTASVTATLDALTRHAAASPGDGVLVGQGWDETGWPEQRPPTGDELERAAPGRRTYLTRVDGHSSVVSPALAALVAGLASLDGWTSDGRVERDAHHAVRAVLEGLIGPDDRLAAARAACAAFAAHGITSFHENAAPHIGPEHELATVRQAAAEAGLHAVAYWGELMAVDTARRLGVRGLAGDLIADGAFGSRTAALATPYNDRPGTCGHAYVSAAQVRDHVVACTEAGLQAGFHCIGDAALEAIGAGFAEAADRLGDDAVRRARHRLEHVEMPAPPVRATLARLGVVASVQPVFDALWGGPSGMYAARLGERWQVTNPFRDLADAGVTLAFGSDSPVTPAGPWAAVRAATTHHHPDQRLGVAAAITAHTRGGALAGHDDDASLLAPGHRADLAVWDTPGGTTDDGLPDLGPDRPLPRLLRTVAAGHTIHTSPSTEDAA